MILAFDIPPKLVGLIVFAAVGVINWWLERKKSQVIANEKQSPSRPLRANAPATGGESEQERLRRFLEALGVPQPPGQPQPPAKARPPAMQPVPQSPAPAPRAIRQTVEPTRRAPISEPRRIPTPTRAATYRTVQQRPAVPEREPMRPAGRLEESSSSIENVSAEFQHMTMAQLGVPAHLADTASTPATLTRNAAAPVVESLRLALRTPADLRTAFVTMELLGKPRGLQS